MLGRSAVTRIASRGGANPPSKYGEAAMEYDPTIASELVPLPAMVPAVATTRRAGGSVVFPQVNGIGIPDYLTSYYWWAYVHPKAVKVFERDWLVNLILWGNYARLRDAALAELGEELCGSTLQVACVYGDLTCRLSDRAAAGGGRIDVVDVLPVQLW